MFWGAIAVTSLILGLSGPFHTYSTMPVVPRVGYWLLMSIVTFFSGWFVGTWAGIALESSQRPRWASTVAAGGAVGLVISLEVLALNWLVLDQSDSSPAYLLAIMANTTAIAMVITAAIHWVLGQSEGRPHTDESETVGHAPKPCTPRLLQRLELDKRSALISLSVQDHYVEVVTTAGRSLLLMRLSDAIEETEGCAGLRVHRSHWVALAAVRAARREGARAILTLNDGREIPVSRSYLPAARAAQLLP